ncbi:cytochrome c oxidase subunit 3 [bacterium]|nr:cytochrome c oxidase subunit 3 [bacterium]
MAHSKPQHDFHLVNPSPWPILMSFAMLSLTLGTALFMHEHKFGEVLMGVGLISILSMMYTWWRDVVRESMVDHAHTPIVRRGLRAGMALFIVSEIMFFFAFFWAFFNASLMPVQPLTDVWAMAKGVWPPKGVEVLDPWHLPFMNTLILLLSGTTVTWAHHALLHNDRKGLIQGLACTVALGIFFTSVQAYEYHHAVFKFKDGIYSSAFYMATGFHGLHVLIGTIFLLVCLLRARRGHFTPEQHLGFEFAAWYWHFVDVVWLFLFMFVYVWGNA